MLSLEPNLIETQPINYFIKWTSIMIIMLIFKSLYLCLLRRNKYYKGNINILFTELSYNISFILL